MKPYFLRKSFVNNLKISKHYFINYVLDVLTNPLKLLPRRIHFKYTYKCNLSCAMCAYKDNRYLLRKEMGDQKLREIFLDLKKTYEKLGYLPELVFTGGEPFIRKDFPELLQFLNELGFSIEVFTNGTMLNKEIADVLLSMRSIKLRISLDGPNEEIHDNVRNVKGSFQRTINGITSLLEQGFPAEKISIAYTISSLNYKYLNEFINNISGVSRKLNFEFQLLNFITQQALDKFKEESESSLGEVGLKADMGVLDLTDIDVSELFEQINIVKDIARKQDLSVLFKSDLDIKGLNNYFYNYDNFALQKRCYEIYRTVRMDCDGSIFPGFINLNMGNICFNNIRDIYYSSKAKLFRKHLSENLFSVCRRCCAIKGRAYYV